MINRKIGIFVFLLCLCFGLMPFQAMAAFTSDAVEPIIPEKECSLTVSYRIGETRFDGADVNLYRVADVSEDFKYTLTQPFASSGLVFDGIRTLGEWDVVRSTLETHIVAHNISPDCTSVTNGDGQANFGMQKTGMYLATIGKTEKDGLRYQFDSALIALPGLGTDGRWQYQLSVNAKGEVLPPINPDEKTEFKVIKLWRGDEGRNDRPNSIEVDIFCDGIKYKNVILSEENNWAYSWSARNDGSRWTVAERNVRAGYTVTVEQRSSTFVLTNSWTPPTPEEPVKPPQTGDTSNIMLYVLLMVGSGTMLIILGVIKRKK